MSKRIINFRITLAHIQQSSSDELRRNSFAVLYSATAARHPMHPKVAFSLEAMER